LSDFFFAILRRQEPWIVGMSSASLALLPAIVAVASSGATLGIRCGIPCCKSRSRRCCRLLRPRCFRSRWSF
jgi:hypothetical protein